MGYTHYWKNEKADKQNWRDAIAEIDEVFRRHRDVIQFEYDDDAKPVANDHNIQFNGIGDDGHETFYVTPEAMGFCFCKTARKPYDTAVCEVLIILNHYCGFEISSDGNFEDWSEAIENQKRRNIEFTPDKLG